tara:strand:- start:748 stop:1197 length:450 start_codon:yes stop_codon:yes gene_type:complete
MPKKKYRCEETLDLEDYIQQKEEREKLQLGSKTYDKCSALESEILDQQFDTDEYGYARPDKFVTPIEASLVRIEEFFNQVIAPLLPKTLRIQLDRNGLMIWDYEYGIERRYHLQQVDPLIQNIPCIPLKTSLHSWWQKQKQRPSKKEQS